MFLLKAPEKKQKLFEDVEKHMKTLNNMKKYYRDKLEVGIMETISLFINLSNTEVNDI